MDQIVSKQKLKHTKYATLQSRLLTFDKAPEDSFLFNNRHDFADAGFFYMGIEDRVICYYCGLGLKDWDKSDIPWEEHALYCGECTHVLVVKGKNFVHKVVRKHNNIHKDHPMELKEPSKTEHQSENEGCIICFSSPKELVFLPCKHCCTCCTCGLMYIKCIYCRTPITSLLKIYKV
jgi:baculoviral IAP repeat-containing protein 7/8